MSDNPVDLVLATEAQAPVGELACPHCGKLASDPIAAPPVKRVDAAHDNPTTQAHPIADQK